MKITIWGDFACPFCYMEEWMLEELINEKEITDESPVELVFRAYQLAPEAPIVPTETMEQHFSHEHNITIEEARNQMARITKMAARAGLNYNLEGVKVCNTFDAHRLMKMAAETADAKTVKKLNFALYHANFIENRRLSSPEVLQEIAESVGLDSEKVKYTLASRKYAEAVRKDEKEADDFGLEYVPYMRFSNGKVLEGVISKGAMRATI